MIGPQQGAARCPFCRVIAGDLDPGVLESRLAQSVALAQALTRVDVS